MNAKDQVNSFGALTELQVDSGKVRFYQLSHLEADGADIHRLPFSIKVLLEAALRHEDGLTVTREDILTLAHYDPHRPAKLEVPFKPARVLVQDFTGVPALVDLAALRSAMHRLGGDPERINPEIPVDLVIDHSVQVMAFGSPASLGVNAAEEFKQNQERYEFLHWGQRAFRNLQVVPPASGICHQVNLEYLARVVQGGGGESGDIVYPDSLVGLDSHTTMAGGLGVLGWGVGGIEAEAVMLGQPMYMLLPEVVGFKLSGQMPPGTTATDLALTVTEILRKQGVVGKFVEFCGEGLSSISLPDRATIANMAPEYGATCGFFPVDQESLRYLRYTGRSPELVQLVERYCKAQGLFRTDDSAEPQFSQVLELDLSSVQPSVAGPRRPQDRIALGQVQEKWRATLHSPTKEGGYGVTTARRRTMTAAGGERLATEGMDHGAVTIAAITSCTNTSNPSVLLAAGLLAKKAVEAGLSVKPYVKTSLAPGSKVVTEYLTSTGLMPYLEQLGFHVVGYGCTTCIGNSGPLPEAVSQVIDQDHLVVASVLSGNRNFEGRIHPLVAANYLASPPLVVAYALAGTVDIDLTTDALGVGKDGQPVTLAQIWPSSGEISALLDQANDPASFRRVYATLLSSNETWNAIETRGAALYAWQEQSSYIQEPPFFDDMTPEPQAIQPITAARVLLKVGDSVTTDHISPAGNIAQDSPAGRYLIEQGVQPQAFNSYGSRRGNDRVMIRGTFANIRLRNQLAGDRQGSWTTHLPSGELLSIYEAACRYQQERTPTIVLAGKDYGMGSSRDWAAKGTYLLGVRAVLACSFERIHRSNLIGMGVLPLEFLEGQSAASLGLTGQERYTFNLNDQLMPGQEIEAVVSAADLKERRITVRCRLDTSVELIYYKNGGILQTVLRRMLAST